MLKLHKQKKYAKKIQLSRKNMAVTAPIFYNIFTVPTDILYINLYIVK